MNQLKTVRFFKQMSQPLLALKSGLQQARISLIQNELVTPKPEEQKKLAKALGVKVTDIFPPEESKDVNGERDQVAV